jgi:hypothetical protein
MPAMNARRDNLGTLILMGRIQIIENYAETRDGDRDRSELCSLVDDWLRDSI